MSRLDRVRRLILTHTDFLAVGCLVVVTCLLLNYFWVGQGARYMFASADHDVPIESSADVTIVLGGGIQNGWPRPVLRGRLDTAAKLLETGKTKKLLLSGDNRFNGYDEPGAMKRYLVEAKGINPELLVLDQAGRSTYETCERARKVFDLDKVWLVSESTHLPRAIFLCRSFGIEAYGIPSDDDLTKSYRVGQRWREFLARTKATLNIYVIGERTVLGDKIDI